MRVGAHACVRVRVCACVRARACVRVRACVCGISDLPCPNTFPYADLRKGYTIIKDTEWET